MEDLEAWRDDEFPIDRFGLGRSTGARRSGMEHKLSDAESNASVSGAEDELYGVPSAFGGSRARRTRKRLRTRPPGSAKENKQIPVQEEPGGWEKHTKGIGAKLLEKMGFTGRLGSHGSGIAEPIQVEIREHESAGLGKGVCQEKSEEAVIAEERRVREKATGEKARSKGAIPRWKKKKRYTDVEDWDEETAKGSGLKERVIDMRSGEAREVGSVSEALAKTHMGSTSGKGSMFGAAELCHNVQLLFDSARVETENAVRARETEKLITDNAGREQKRLLHELESVQKSRKEIVKLEEELRCLSGAESDEQFAEILEEGCGTVLEECQAEKPRFVVREVLIGLAEPRIRSCFRAAIEKSGADSAKQGGIAARILQAVRTPLCGGGGVDFLRLCARTVLRETRALSLNVLNAESVAGAMTLLRDAVEPIVMSTFAEEILLPALEVALGRREDGETPPPHVWMHVWLPVVGADSLETLFPALRSRIARELESWNPASSPEATKRAQHELRAWIGVIPRRKLHATMSRTVLPKIDAYLRDAEPAAQVSIVAAVVSSWADLAPARALADVLVPALWNQVRDVRDSLFVRPRKAGSAAECARQYLAWKNAFGTLQKYVRHVLSAFLFVLVADARSIGDLSMRSRLAAGNVRQLGVNLYRREREKKSTPVQLRRMGVGERASIGDAVAALAQSKGLALLPDGRDQDGRAVFNLGKVRIVLDGARQLVLRVKTGNGRQVLEPISITKLMNVAPFGLE